ncbi:quinoprotein dehydrogenase-associated SoxYZ-like carrier [Roseicella sp. DB1501]|uniref:quinoprotein dehydrogenase-associated SoxYZ-like carrier n=1 Tax=Roseicella sp. DB1501 TaxID=2730925 RepID=UPI0014932506|nr:quinoprotein dehydrogenase-associated SoxYZ-like carrier [Roseicella sp. DB1501]NOG73122.1 quinoprotein dehydrogenase-associated SoxYZ-like carrier [Roseicella sp. DB1501]
MPLALRRRSALLIAPLLATPLLAPPGLARAQGIEPAEAPRRAERWRDLKQAILGNRPTLPAGAALELTAPARAQDAALVPIAIALSAEAAPAVRAIYLTVDENPLPLAAVFRAGRPGALRALTARIRVDAYTNLHAVAETSDGRLLETTRFVKAAGGCSAPIAGDLEAARQRMGRMRMTLPEGPPAPGRAVPVQVAVSHPNTSGLQIDQLTRLSIPAEYVRALRITYAGAELLRIESEISIAENPTFGFTLDGEPGGELRVVALDNRDRRFEGHWTLGAAG